MNEPKQIWLQVGEDWEDTDDISHYSDVITWHHEKVFDTDIGPYVLQEERIDLNAVRTSINKYCACGGSGPDDPGCCAACNIWHELTMV